MLTFLAPWGLALGALLPVLVLLYLLKVRRREQAVSSTYIWRHLVRDMAAHEPFQKLKITALLIAQLLLLAALVLAFARPSLPIQSRQSQFAVVVLDASASMQATDVAPSRFDAALARTRDLLGQLPEGSTFTVIRAARHPEVLLSEQQDADQAARTLARARPTNSAADVNGALRLAVELAGDRPQRHVYLISDGALGNLQTPDLRGAALSFVSVGGGDDNRAVTAISTRPDPRDARQVHLFVRVRNYAAAPARVNLVLNADGKPVEARPLALGANGAQDVVFDSLPAGARVVEAHLDGTDALAADDSATVVLGNRPPSRVLLVSAGNLFLEKLLRIIPGLDLYGTQPERYFVSDTESYDMVVFDNYFPEQLPRGNVLALNPPNSALFPIQAPVDHPRITFWDKDNPLLRFVDLREVGIAHAQAMVPPGWAQPLIQAGDVPLLLAGDDGTRRMVVFPFDLRQSNLPLSVAFPILMSNVVGYLQPPGLLDVKSLAPGQPETLIPLPQADDIRVTRPDGTTQPVTAKAGAPLLYDATDEIGLYEVSQRQGDQVLGSEAFAVNLTDEAESDIRPGPGPSGAVAADAGGGPLTTIQREIWLPLALLAAALLVGEWWLYHRRSA